MRSCLVLFVLAVATSRLGRRTGGVGHERPAGRHHRHRHLARARVHRPVREASRMADQGRGRVQGGQPRYPGQRRPAGKVRQDAPRANTTSRSSTASTRCSRRSTSCSWRASTAGRTSPRPRPCLKAKKAAVHRQAAGGQPRRRPRDRQAVEGDGHAVLQFVVVPFPQRHPTAPRQPRRGQGDEGPGQFAVEHAQGSPRPVLLRHPRRRGTLRGDGPGLRQRLAEDRRDGRRHHRPVEGRPRRRLLRPHQRREAADDPHLGRHGHDRLVRHGGYDGLVQAIAEFFQTGRPPVDVAETIELFEFMTAAQVSKERNGAAVPLAELRK